MLLPTCDHVVGQEILPELAERAGGEPDDDDRPRHGRPAGSRGRAGRLDRPVDPRQDAIATERDERVEERRRRRATGDRDADRHEEVAGLPAAGLGQRAQRRLELVGLEGQLARAVDDRRGRPSRPSRVVAASQRFGTSVAGSSCDRRRPTGSRRGRRSRRASAGAPGRPGAGPAARRRTASGRSGRRPARPRRTAAAGRRGRRGRGGGSTGR